MPREARLDIPGFLYHVLCRGIEGRTIFLDDHDHKNFCNRLKTGLSQYKTQCLAWALMPNHAHLLLRAGLWGLAPLMRSLLTGYAGYFNKKYQRSGHLFQNRYKSIICQEDGYLQELVRYIHLNPLRAGLAPTLEDLIHYPWCGCSALLGRQQVPWQDTVAVLKEFGDSATEAKVAYRAFLADSLARGQSIENPLSPLFDRCQQNNSEDQANEHQKSFSSQILGSEQFAQGVLAQAEKMEIIFKKLRDQGIDLEKLTNLVAQKFEVPPSSLKNSGRQKQIVKARSVLIQLGVDCLGKTITQMADWTKLSIQAASKSCVRGRRLNQGMWKVDLENLDLMMNLVE
ncbi:MAG: transposase [Elusimicrobia bacterium]|nr:transposase [Elusimicrobiota bacterium]